MFNSYFKEELLIFYQCFEEKKIHVSLSQKEKIPNIV